MIIGGQRATAGDGHAHLDDVERVGIEVARLDIGVSVRAGRIVLKRIPATPYSQAPLRVNALMPPLAAA